MARLSGSERRRRILDCAARAFAEQGYRATSMRDIAAAAGVTKPVLYDHFASKQRLYVELIEATRDDLVARTAEAMRLEAPAEARVRISIESFFAYLSEHPDATRVLFRTPEGEPAVVSAAALVQAQATETLVALLAPEPDVIPDAPDRQRRLELAMEFVKRGMHGLAGWWAEHPEAPRATVVDAAVAIAWGGLGGLFRSR